MLPKLYILPKRPVHFQLTTIKISIYCINSIYHASLVYALVSCFLLYYLGQTLFIFKYLPHFAHQTDLSSPWISFFFSPWWKYNIQLKVLICFSRRVSSKPHLLQQCGTLSVWAQFIFPSPLHICCLPPAFLRALRWSDKSSEVQLREISCVNSSKCQW